MTFMNSGSDPMEPDYLIGIAIKATNVRLQSMHVGIVYRRVSGEAFFAHLADNCHLQDEPAPNSDQYLWANPQWLSDPAMQPNAEFIANFVEMCTRTKNIPYGPNPPRTAFDENGSYNMSNVREGLTCATYVSEVFAASGFPVVQLDTWPSRPDDKNWWENTAAYLSKAHPSRAVELKDVEAAFRLRPNEVATAVEGRNIPVNFEEVVSKSEHLKSLLFPSSANEAVGVFGKEQDQNENPLKMAHRPDNV